MENSGTVRFLAAAAVLVLVAARPEGASALWSPFATRTLSTPREQFEYAHSLEGKGSYRGAMDAYQALADNFSSSPLAAEAQFKVAEMLEKTRHFYAAFNAYQAVLDKYPSYPKVNLVLKRQLQIGNYFLQGRAIGFLSINPKGSRKRAINIYRKMLSSAPFSEVAPQAQYNLGLAYMQNGEYIEAVIEFEKIAMHYPHSDFVSSAKYQIGACAHAQAVSAPYDQEAAHEAISSLNEYIQEFPRGEHAETAKEMLKELRGIKAASLYEIGTYYEQCGNPRASLIYLKEVIKDYPLTVYAEKARRTAQREEKKLEVVDDLRKARDEASEIARLIRSQKSAIDGIKGKGREGWRFWRYLFPRKLSDDGKSEVASRGEKIEAMEKRLSLARLEVAEREALMANRFRSFAAEAGVERLEDEIRAMGVRQQVARSKLAGSGGLPESEKGVMEAAGREVAGMEEAIGAAEARLKTIRSSLESVVRDVEEKEKGIRELYARKRSYITEIAKEGKGAPAGGGAAPAGREERKDSARRGGFLRWLWPWGRVSGLYPSADCASMYEETERIFDLAERHRLERNWSDALREYDRASVKLMDLRTTCPAFRQEDVERMLKGCSGKLDEMRQESSAREYAELAGDLEQRITENPKDADAQFSLGLMRIRKGETEKAIDAFKAAISISPDSAKSHYQLGMVYAEKGEIQKAVESLRRAVEINPTEATYLHNYGALLRDLGDYNGAREAFERAIAANPSFAPSYFSVGHLYQSALGDRSKAAYYWEKYVALRPDDPLAPEIMAWVKMEKKSGARAKSGGSWWMFRK